MSRFVRPETVILPLTQGDTITIKRRLTAGEQRAAYARLYVVGDTGRLQARVNPLESGLAMILAYLVDWNLTDDDGAPVPIRGLSVGELESILNSLDPESFAEIKTAIEGHEARMGEERAQEKKRQAGSNGDGVISRSPSVAAGAWTGSETLTPTTTRS